MARLRAFQLCSAIWLLGLILVPEQYADAWYLFFVIALFVVCYRRVNEVASELRRPIRLAVIAAAFSIVGSVIRTLEGSSQGIEYPVPSMGDPFTIVSVVCFIWAILSIVHRRNPRLGLDPMLDAGVAAVAVGLLQWSVVLIPLFHDDVFGSTAKAMVILFSVTGLIEIAAAVLALVAGSVPSVSNRFLAAGLVGAFAMDLMATLVAADRLNGETLVFVSGIVFVLGATGLLHPSVHQLLDRPADQNMARRMSRRRITVLALALLTPPVLMLGAAIGDGWDLRKALPAIASLALTPLVLVRLGRLVHQNQELASLESSLREVSERLVSAETADDVVRVITVGAENILGSNLSQASLILDPLGLSSPVTGDSLGQAIEQFITLASTTKDLTTGKLLSLPSGEGERWLAGLVLTGASRVGALLLVTSRELREDERNAVMTLCRESAIALRAVEQTERQVRQRSEERFGALINNSSDIVAIANDNLDLRYVSPVAERLLGYPLEQLHLTEQDQVGQTEQPFEAAAPINVLDLVHREDREITSHVLEAIQEGRYTAAEVRLRHFDGTWVWFEIVGVDLTSDPNIAGIVLTAREVGARKRAEELLRASEARFKALVQNSTDLVLVVDDSEFIRYASPSIAEMVGYDSESVNGLSFNDVFLMNDLDWGIRTEDGSSRDDALIEFSFELAPDDVRTVETTISDLRDEPAVEGFVLNARDITYRKTMEQQLRFHATHDELTGLVNRAHALANLDGILQRNSGATTVAAIHLDIDDFKDVNDSLGHEFGDRLLKAVSDRLGSVLSFGDIAARIGGDDFVIVLERSHGENRIMELVEQLLTSVTNAYDIDGREISLTVTAGVVFDHDRSSSGEVMLRNADTAMYRAKNQGKRQVVVFESYMHTATFDRLELRADLARAVAHNQFVAYYQPIVELKTRKIVGAEALVRWNHPTRGLLGPVLFIPLAEESGLIGPLGEWVLDRACTDLSRWRQDFGQQIEDFTISVNLSVHQLRGGGIISTVSDTLRRVQLPAKNLVLEITESTLLTESGDDSETMKELRRLGASLSIDDFGTGYSSLGYIQQFEFDILKIDKSFVDEVDRHTNQRIVTAVLDLAKNLDVKTIAEGIEDQSQVEILDELGCQFGQGYTFSRPVPEAEFRELLVADHALSKNPQS